MSLYVPHLLVSLCVDGLPADEQSQQPSSLVALSLLPPPSYLGSMSQQVQGPLLSVLEYRVQIPVSGSNLAEL